MTRLYSTAYPTRLLEALRRDEPYDAVLAALGFETRSREISMALPPPHAGVALTFGDRREIAFEDNERAFRGRRYELLRVEPADMQGFHIRWLTDLAASHSGPLPLRVAVDISSMTRARIAAVVQALMRAPLDVRIVVDFLYTAAEFAPAGPRPVSTLSIAPVSSAFAGWTPDLDLPTLAIVGLGYELELADGVIEYLDPDRTVLYIPNGYDGRFLGEVKHANSELLRGRQARRDSHSYYVEDPYALLLDLDRRIAGTARDARVLLVPLGPKIFALNCMIAAAMHEPLASVWRVRSDELAAPTERLSNGRVTGLRVSNRPFDPAEESLRLHDPRGMD